MQLKKNQLSLLTFFIITLSTFGFCSDPKEYYAVPPPQYPSEDEGMLYILDASYTFWAPYQNGMFLLTTNSTTGQNANWIKTAFPAQSGFKAGLGVNTFHDGWKLQAEYTWFYNHPGVRTSSLQVPNIEYYSPWVEIPDPSTVESISSKFNNTFQRVDLTLDRTYYLGNYLAVGPWIGLVGAWDDQYFYVKTIPRDNPAPPTDSQIPVMTQSMNWWAIGAYLGVDSSFYFVDEWAIFFTGGGSLNLAVHYTDKLVTDASKRDAVISTNTGTKIPAVEPMFETSVGLRWDSAGQDWALRLQMGWELQAWLDHSTFIQGYGANLDPSIAYGTYAMQGLTVKIRLNF
jgi:hypothetical protein